jgi:hypothetical protein
LRPDFQALLTEDALGNEVEDVRKAASLVRSAGECFDEGGKMFDHFVIIRGIVGSDAEYLSKIKVCIFYYYNFAHTLSLIPNASRTSVNAATRFSPE